MIWVMLLNEAITPARNSSTPIPCMKMMAAKMVKRVSAVSARVRRPDWTRAPRPAGLSQ